MARTTPIYKPCAECGKVFLAKFQFSCEEHQRRCSLACYRKYQSKAWGDPAERFWSKVDSTSGDCWIFKGCRDSWGYAHYGVKGKRTQAHRYAYELTYGPIPAGKVLMHTCDNPPCVRPDHLRVGTNAENHRDAVVKRRHAHGERNSHAILTERQVLELRRRYQPPPPDKPKAKTNIEELAKEFGVSKATAYHAAVGNTWKHL
jgi:hypothetical protein